MAKKDYYEILGVQRECTIEEIKLSYKKLARKYHPDVAEDKAEAEVRFREINEAYSVLADDKKRATYDRYGTVSGPAADFGGSPFGGFGFGGVDLSDILEQVFMGGRGGGGRRARRGEDHEEILDLTLEDVLNGVDKEMEVSVYDECTRCQGSGAESGTEPRTCDECRGSGAVRHVVTSPFGQVVRTVACVKCAGRGSVITTPCSECKGHGHAMHRKRVSLKVPPGVDDGNYIRMAGLGDAGSNGGPHGDLIVFLRVKPHDVFRREREDLFLERPITFTDAALGSEIEVPTLEVPAAKIKVPAGTQSHTTFKIRGKGLPRGRGGSRGDLQVRVVVMVPTQLNDKQKQLLREYGAAGSQEAHGHHERGWFGRIVDAILG